MAALLQNYSYFLTGEIMWKRRRLDGGIAVPLHALHIGMPVHLKGTDFGCVWIITSIASISANGELAGDTTADVSMY